MKKNLSTILLVLVFLVGLSVLLYPTVSSYWNSRVQSRAIMNYEATVQNLNQKDYEALLKKADNYNACLRKVNFPLANYEEVAGYESILDITGTGIMGYIDIEKINVELPIYHGVSEAVLNVAAGHLEGSSLPVGGAGTHAVLSAHRGLPSAKLFTDLDQLEIGDSFTVTVLNRTLLYEVDQILIVEPDEVKQLAIEKGKDYCTLLTCTPYGINTHRLLVRGKRAKEISHPNLFVPNEAHRIDPLIVTPVVAVPMLLILLAVLLVKYRNKK